VRCAMLSTGSRSLAKAEFGTRSRASSASIGYGTRCVITRKPFAPVPGCHLFFRHLLSNSNLTYTISFLKCSLNSVPCGTRSFKKQGRVPTALPSIFSARFASRHECRTDRRLRCSYSSFRPRAGTATVLSSLQHPYIYFQHFNRLIKMSVTATRNR
jgi:hypothetical protein